MPAPHRYTEEVSHPADHLEVHEKTVGNGSDSEHLGILHEVWEIRALEYSHRYVHKIVMHDLLNTLLMLQVNAA